VGEESLAIPRAKLEAKKGEENVCVKKGRTDKKRRKVNIKEDYIQSLLKEIADLKELNTEQKTTYESEIQGFKNLLKENEEHARINTKARIFRNGRIY